MPFPELLLLSPRIRQRLAGWVCVLSYAWAAAAPLAHAGRVLPLEGTGRYSHRESLENRRDELGRGFLSRSSPLWRCFVQGQTVTKLRSTTRDKLIGVNLPDGKTYNYTYDYRTRRIATAQAPTGGLAAKHTAVTFSGGLSVAEFDRASNTTISIPTVRCLRGPDMGGGVGGLLYSARLETTGSQPAALSLIHKYNLSNGRGDVVAQSDSSGALTWTASYEAYGKRTKETGTNADKQRANSKDEDPTGLLNEGFRYRDIETGVWLSRDPAGFVDGPNLYAYVKQNPWTSWDPEGLSVWTKAFKALKNGGNMAQTTAGLVDDFNTFTSPDSGFGDRFCSAWSMLSELLPASVGDVKDGYKYGKKLLSRADDVKDVTKPGGMSAQDVQTQAKKLAKELEDRKQAALNKPAHGNTAGDQDASLYERFDKDGNFQKHGVAEDLDKRYSKKELDGGTLVEVDRGPRKEILQKERQKVETNPGPLNKEPWAGKQSAPPPPTPTPAPKPTPKEPDQ